MTKTEIKLLKAVSESTRFTILKLLMDKPSGVFVSAIIKKMKIEPTLLSHHLSLLKSAGLVISTRHGKTVRYTMDSKCKFIEGRFIVTKAFSFKVQ